MTKNKSSQFIFIKSDDPSEDSFYMNKDNSEVTIQETFYDYPNIYYVNLENQKDSTMTSFPCKSLEEAKTKALSLINN